MKRIVVLTGAGISAESGIKTFRDAGGLWENYKIEDVATPQAWNKNPNLVLDFYNKRRKQVIEAKPNAAHIALTQLEEKYIVNIITQNIDDLHERAGSRNILHLHGEILKSRSSLNPSIINFIDGWELKIGDKCKMGSQLRPHIVWFGEAVPAMEEAIPLIEAADIIIVIGTSLAVYPAAGLLDYAEETEKFLIDPHASPANHIKNIRIIRDTAGKGVPNLVHELLKRND
jgi:NAD-dependent deacetylase